MNLKNELEVARIIGWPEYWRIQWRWYEFKSFLERIWFCHHNARVLVETEWKLSCVLNMTTRGMSKTGYKLQDMRAEIMAFLDDKYDEGYEDGYSDGRADGDKANYDAAHAKGYNEGWTNGVRSKESV